MLYDCRILRAEARRKDINSSRVVQKLAAETNMDEYRRLLAVSAPAARFKITANWAPNEKYVAVQGEAVNCRMSTECVSFSSRPLQWQ